MTATPRLTLLALTCAALTACSSSGGLLESDTIDYKSAKKSNSLEMPPDLVSPRQDERYAMPAGGTGAATWSDYHDERNAQSQRVGSEDVLVQVPDMHIERSGEQRWLVIEHADAAKLWPELRMFWEQLGFNIQTDRPDIGIMETDWAEDRAKIPQDFIRRTIGKVFDQAFSTGLRDRFRTRIEIDARAPTGTVNVYISHRGMEEVYADKNKDRTVWQPRPSDPELEAEMLRRLMIHLGIDKQKAADKLAASAGAAAGTAAPASPVQATLVAEDGQPPFLRIGLDFERAWRQVGVALDRSDFTVEDRNREEGLYYVRYIDTDQARAEKGFFAKLAFWRGDAPINSEFRVQLKSDGGDSARTIVRILNAQNQPESSETARRILSLLHEKLQ